MRSASCKASFKDRGSKARGLDRIDECVADDGVPDNWPVDAWALSNILVLQSCDGWVGFVWEFLDVTTRSKTVGSAFGRDGSVRMWG